MSVHQAMNMSNWTDLVSTLCLGLILIQFGFAQQAAGMPTNQQQQVSGSNNAEQAQPAPIDFDVVPNYQLKPLAFNNLRLRRQVANLIQQQQAANENGQQRSVSQLPQALDDEQLIRNQLPELIAQAHTDKQAERMLLKMLFNPSLRSALSNMLSPSSSQLQSTSSAPYLSMAPSSLTPQQQRQLLMNLDDANNWLEVDGSTSQSLDGSQPANLRNSNRAVLARLEQQQQLQSQGPTANELASLESILARPSTGQYPTQSFMDKREYIKPCSFNAISCVRTPFRKV